MKLFFVILFFLSTAKARDCYGLINEAQSILQNKSCQDVGKFYSKLVKCCSEKSLKSFTDHLQCKAYMESAVFNNPNLEIAKFMIHVNSHLYNSFINKETCWPDVKQLIRSAKSARKYINQYFQVHKADILLKSGYAVGEKNYEKWVNSRHFLYYSSFLQQAKLLIEFDICKKMGEDWPSCKIDVKTMIKNQYPLTYYYSQVAPERQNYKKKMAQLLKKEVQKGTRACKRVADNLFPNIDSVDALDVESINSTQFVNGTGLAELKIIKSAIDKITDLDSNCRSPASE